ncbi:MAG TPA: universal stress protein [Thermoanaerobaculia bacterium]|nr:universal stress protein [Thermoanaerobaculia bacterium]
MSGERILVPTDLSEFSVAALKYAAMLRGPLRAAMTVVYADEPGYPTSMPDLPMAVRERPPGEKPLVLETMRRHVEKHIPPPAPELRSAFGFAAQVIATTAEEIDATLIVMGTHGRRGFRRLMLGSVTESVLRETLRSLLTLGPGAIAEQPAQVRTILCPVNFSFVALDAMRRAATFASCLEAELVVLYVAEEKQPPLTEELERELDTWVAPELRGRSRYRQMIAAGNAAERVLEIADQVGAGLLVIGAQHRRFRSATVIGTTTERLVRFAGCAVLTVPRGAQGS